MQPVFVLGVKRSGTTLVQRILNSYPDTLIWGEHQGFLRHVAEGYYQAANSRCLFALKTPWQKRLSEADPHNFSRQQWLNPFDRAQWAERHRQFLESVFIPAEIRGKMFWGFKEVDYGVLPWDKTLDFLHEIFPQAVFVFVARDALNFVASAKHADDGRSPTLHRDLPGICETWRKQNECFLRWHASGRAQTFFIRYEELIQGRGEILSLLKNMGKTWGPAQQAVLEADKGRGTSFPGASADYLNRWKVLPLAWRLVAAARLGRLSEKLGFPDVSLSPPARAAAALIETGMALRRFAGGLFWRSRRLLKKLIRGGRARS